MISQLAIFVFGLSAVWLANDPRPNVRRWGCIAGLISQPFWFYATFTAGQWGIFASSFIYSYCWLRGFYFQWWKTA